MATHRSKLTLTDALALAVGCVGLIALMVAGYIVGVARSQPASAASPIIVTAPAETVTAPLTLTPPPPSVDTETAPAPGMIPQFAPPDGPDPDDPMFGVDVVALATELRTHAVDTPVDQYPQLLAIANRHIARGVPDLMAWDPLITADVKELYPNLRRGLVIDVTRCFAEYVERVEARNAGKAAPPDSDDHNVTVDKRAPQARITKHPIVTPTS